MHILSPPFHLQTLPSIITAHLLPPKALKTQPLSRNGRNKSCRRSSIRCSSRKDFVGKEEINQEIHNKKKSSTETVTELLFGDETANVSFSLPALLILSGKKQIYGMICHFITFLKRHIEFVVRPSADGGADFGLRWHIEWKDKHLHLGSGCTLDLSHVYNGRIFLRNGKALIDPLLNWKATKLIGKESLLMIFINTLDKIAKKDFSKGKTKLLGLSYLFICFIFMAVIFTLSQKL